MSAPTTLLRLMADGKPWTPEQLSRESGLDRRRVDNALRVLRAGEYMRSLPQPYQITAAGLDRLAEREGKEPALAPGETTTARAVRVQPPLQAAWKGLQ